MTRRAQEGLESWPGDTEGSDSFTTLWGLGRSVGRAKRPRRAMDLEGPGKTCRGWGGQSLKYKQSKLRSPVIKRRGEEGRVGKKTG